MAGDLWNARYAKEGEIWERAPSLTAEFLRKRTPLGGSVFEIGFGYGRDVIPLAEQGYNVTAIERSHVGHSMAIERLRGIPSVNPTLIQGDFLDAALPAGEYDAVWSHRVIHLLDNKYAVQAYAERVAEIVKDNGLALISARDPRGVKPDRPGHHVSFWDEKRFQETFGQDFEIEQLIQGEEIESASNPVQTYFTLMVARRKPRLL